jgi:hypothetical protein
MENKPRILVVDIETAPAKLYGWGLYNQNFGVEQIAEHPYILCIGYKWIGDRKVSIVANWEMTQVEMLNHIIDLITEADMVVSKNGIKFDIPWIRTEIAKYKLRALPPLTHMDLQKVAKNYFRFLSNKLDYIVQYLGIGKKVEHEGFGLWRKVMSGEVNGRRRMKTYCRGDVKVTEDLYKYLMPYIQDHPILRPLAAEACPSCGSKHTQKRGYRYTRFFKIRRHQCSDCGAWFQGKRTKAA